MIFGAILSGSTSGCDMFINPPVLPSCAITLVWVRENDDVSLRMDDINVCTILAQAKFSMQTLSRANRDDTRAFRFCFSTLVACCKR
jgi:hypothetical protein